MRLIGCKKRGCDMATHEIRPNDCWKCKYFFPYIDIALFGFCFRRAPSRIDWTVGSVAQGTQFGQFSRIVDGTLVVCGDYEKLPGPIPALPER
jgi:hypothetical protein